MDITNKDLDKRICDVTGGTSTQTYREFIRESEEGFNMASEPIDRYPDDELNMYLTELNYLRKEME